MWPRELHGTRGDCLFEKVTEKSKPEDEKAKKHKEKCSRQREWHVQRSCGRAVKLLSLSSTSRSSVHQI